MAEMLSDFGHIIGLNGSTQVAVMPTYSTVAVGTIVQYVGATDANYTNGYFYKATVSGWEVVDVQGEDTDKADKVASATAGNLAGLDVNGNLTDSGVAAGNTSISSIGDGTLTGAVSSENGAIDAIVNVYGSKNLIPYLYYDSTKELSGLTFNANSDGSVSVSGLATGNIAFYMVYNKTPNMYLKNGTYILSGCPNVNRVSVDLVYYDTNNNETVITDSGNGATFTINGSYNDPNGATISLVQCAVYNGTDCTTPITFYPMLRDARISDSTYVPYAMTNRELTENVGNITTFNPVTFTANLSDVTINDCDAYSIGNIVSFFINFTITSNHILYDLLINVSKVPKLISVAFPVMDGNTYSIYSPTQYSVYIDRSGHFCVSGSGLPAGTYVVTGTYIVV